MGNITSLESDIYKTLVVSMKLMQSKKPKSFSRFWLKESFANQTVFLHFWMLTIYLTLLNVFCITFNNMILMKANVRSWNLSALYNFFCYFWLFWETWNFDFLIFAFSILDEYWRFPINWFLLQKLGKVSIFWN